MSLSVFSLKRLLTLALYAYLICLKGGNDVIRVRHKSSADAIPVRIYLVTRGVEVYLRAGEAGVRTHIAWTPSSSWRRFEKSRGIKRTNYIQCSVIHSDRAQ